MAGTSTFGHACQQAERHSALSVRRASLRFKKWPRPFVWRAKSKCSPSKGQFHVIFSAG